MQYEVPRPCLCYHVQPVIVQGGDRGMEYPPGATRLRNLHQGERFLSGSLIPTLSGIII